MKELDEIIRQLKETIKLTNIKVSENVLFENAVDIFISDRINEAKKKPFFDNNWKSSESLTEPLLKNEQFFKDNTKPTEKQTKFMEKHKIPFNFLTSRKKATELINNYIATHPK